MKVKKLLTPDQLMWIDVISSTLFEERFDLNLGDMNYVIRNMIAKYVSSALKYNVSEGVEQLIDNNPAVFKGISSSGPNELTKWFYGGKSESSKLGKPTMFEHSIPAAVIRDRLIQARSTFLAGTREEFKAEVTKILCRSGRVVIVLKEENARLLRYKMPRGWDYESGDDLERYLQASPPVIVSKKYHLPRDGRICR